MKGQVAVQSLQQGGDLWQQAGGRELITPAADSSEAASSSPFSIDVSDSVTELARDPYYSSGYASDWHIFATAQETALMAMLPQPSTQARSSSSVSSRGGSGSGGSADTAKLNGSCVTISGPWLAGTRYQITVTVHNPAAPASPPAAAAKPPGVWMVPLQYLPQHNSSGQEVGWAVRVRGDKLGQMCSIRQQVAALLPGMFSACGEAAARGWVPAGKSNAEVCLTALQEGLASAADAATLRSVFPFTAPPLAAGGPDSAPEAACAEGSLLSPAFGGECIDCSNAAPEGAICRCLPGFVSNLVGPAACGPAVGLNSNASDAAALAAQLCDAYASYYEKMMQGELADHLVHSMYLETFMQQTAYLMDWGFLQDANASFWQQYVVDERMPSSPSRRTGVGPKCSSCDRQGMFRDIYTKQQVRATLTDQQAGLRKHRVGPTPEAAPCLLAPSPAARTL
ncbi:hypothetical protein OEZ86_006833 [Tetradesmus obliquus]|nr:hypothetical protein OEZ86_006833 [Tetradesmus obliquus]